MSTADANKDVTDVVAAKDSSSFRYGYHVVSDDKQATAAGYDVPELTIEPVRCVSLRNRIKPY